MNIIHKIIDAPFKELVTDRWKEQGTEFKDKYGPYRSKYLKSQDDIKSEKIGIGKKIEMLYAAGYEILVFKPTK